MDVFDFSTAAPELLLSEVKRHPWAYFRVPQALRTKEMAVLAWDTVSPVLSRMGVEASPTDQGVKEEEWNQFMAFLCGSYLNYVLLSENLTSWKQVVEAINDFMASQNTTSVDVSEPLPTIE